MGITINAVDWSDETAVALRKAMTEEVAALYAGGMPKGGEIDPATVLYTGLAVADGRAIGHAALRRVGDDVELKRMYVAPEYRGTGVSVALMAAVEDRARAAGAPRLVLRTGVNQPGAIRLYERLGYTPIPVYGQYREEPELRFYAKTL